MGLQQARIINRPRWRTHLWREAIPLAHKFFINGLRVGQLSGNRVMPHLSQSITTKRGGVAQQMGALPTPVRRHLRPWEHIDAVFVAERPQLVEMLH